MVDSKRGETDQTGERFTLLDWAIHFGVAMNIVVSLFIVWYVISR